MTSPVTDLEKPFSIASSLLPVELNTFIELGKGPKGRIHFVLFYDKPIGYDYLQLVTDTAMVHSTECIQYTIKSSEGRPVGSFFDTNAKKTRIAQDRVTVIDSDLTEMVSINHESFSGVFVYTDREDSFLLIPESPNINKYMVI